MPTQNISAQPAGRLVPIFCANDHLDAADTALALAQSSASAGDRVLMVDCLGGALMRQAGVAFEATLADALRETVPLSEATYITPEDHFTIIAAGDTPLDAVLGSLAALSLDYDWVFVGTPSGFTPGHVRLAGAADMSLLAYDSASDHFMRAYWMIDACRNRYPRFDPLLVSVGDPEIAAETATLLTQTVADFLGAPPSYLGHLAGENVAGALFSSVQQAAGCSAAA